MRVLGEEDGTPEAVSRSLSLSPVHSLILEVYGRGPRSLLGSADGQETDPLPSGAAQRSPPWSVAQVVGASSPAPEGGDPIPGQGTHLGFRFSPRSEHVWETTDRFVLLPSSLSKTNKRAF